MTQAITRGLFISVLGLLLVSGASGTATASPKVEIDVRPTSVSLGQPVAIQVTIPWSGLTTANLQLTWPNGTKAVPATSEDSSSVDWTTWTLLREQWISAPETGRLTKEWIVVPFANGELEGPIIDISYRTSEETEGSVSAQATTVSVGLTRAATDDTLRAIRPPVPVPLPRWFWTALGSLVFLGTALVTWLAWTWMKAAHARRNPPPTLEQILETRIEELRSLELPKARRYREFFTRLTDLLRQYLEERWMVPAPDLTTRELRLRIEEQLQDLPLEPAMELVRILEEADEVKFAKGQVTTEICSRALDRSVLLSQAFRAELVRRAEAQLAAQRPAQSSHSPGNTTSLESTPSLPSSPSQGASTP